MVLVVTFEGCTFTLTDLWKPVRQPDFCKETTVLATVSLKDGRKISSRRTKICVIVIKLLAKKAPKLVANIHQTRIVSHLLAYKTAEVDVGLFVFT